MVGTETRIVIKYDLGKKSLNSKLALLFYQCYCSLHKVPAMNYCTLITPTDFLESYAVLSEAVNIKKLSSFSWTAKERKN